MTDLRPERLLLHELAGALCALAWRKPCVPFGAASLEARLEEDLAQWAQRRGLTAAAHPWIQRTTLRVEPGRSREGVIAAFDLCMEIAPEPGAGGVPLSLRVPIPDPPPPEVAYRSDADGNLHLFSNDGGARDWEVFVHDMRGARRPVPLDREPFLAAGAHLEAPGAHAWCIDDLDGTQVEVCRPGLPPACLYPPGWRHSRAR